MDSKFRILLNTFFKGELDTKDVYALIKYIFGKEPMETTFSIDNNNCIFIDFLYDDGVLASEYIELNLYRLTDYKSNVGIIAKELTDIMFINDDIKEYILQSKKLKKFIRLYKNSNTMHKAVVMKNQQKRLMSIGIDETGYDFIKDTIFPTHRK
ncbi:putative 17 kDa protein [Turkeypox virus]|uniref:17 kDa protein n=1 Tax=Turkeypox virus TaxID=336486 RepID=A0A0M3ZK33_9POXV|nr:putative 17 kDa protein [Turkeypox virus]ALA62482.1 putative 17 kDa protein [Turkeypox virus]